MNWFLSSDIDEIVQKLSDVSHKFSGKTLILTGGRGFLGRYFMEVFNKLNQDVLEKPLRLFVLDNLITAGKQGSDIPNYPNIEFINHNVIEPFVFKDKVDYVIHAAGIASPFYYRAYPMETLEVAINGTKNMLDLAKEKKARFVFFSSSEIYGDPDPNHVPISESYRGNVACQGPRACYDESKRVGETLCYIYHTNNGCHTNTIRPFNIYGPGMQETDYRVLPNFASKIKAGKPLQVYGTGNQTRTFCYVSDAINGFMRVFLNGVAGSPYNIGNPHPEISVLELVKKLESISDTKVTYKVIDYPDSYPADEPIRRAPDIFKAKIQLDYNPQVAIEEGLKRFLDWSNMYYIGV